MTIKEISDFTGKNKSTVGRWVAKCNSYISDKLQNATKEDPADFSLGDVEEILMNSSMSRDTVRILIENANYKNNLPTQSEKVDYEVIGKMIGMAVSAAMQPVVNQLQSINTKALPEPVKEDYYTLTAYCSLNGYKINRSEMALHGKHLSASARERGLELKAVPDERWGKVNSYPVEVLDDHFRL